MSFESKRKIKVSKYNVRKQGSDEIIYSRDSLGDVRTLVKDLIATHPSRIYIISKDVFTVYKAEVTFDKID